MALTLPLRLFAGVGVELEYMIVSRDSLDVLPRADAVLRAVAGAGTDDISEVEVGPLCWSNELVLHVIELKTNGPAASVHGLAAHFAAAAARISRILEPLGGRLMATGMHPWMSPRDETRLWPHAGRPVYAAYDRIFGCRQHGFANVQSAHINLPFCGDQELAKLHAAIRLVLPVLPALAASSPVVDGAPSGALDNRLLAYRRNQARVPSVAGLVVPESIHSRADYEKHILAPMYSDIAPLDPAGALRGEWLNSRGAIARFERDTIEIRLLDVQEAPHADLAVAAITVEAVRALVQQRWGSLEQQHALRSEKLAVLLDACVHRGDAVVISDAAYLAAFGLSEARITAGELWRHIASAVVRPETVEPPVASALETILQRGPLARRIMAALGGRPSRGDIHAVYERLCDCLDRTELFLP